VVDAVAGLLQAGRLDRGGRFVLEEDSHGRVRAGSNGVEYVIADASQSSLGADLVLTQKDVRQIQLAKAALFVAAQSLLSHLGIDAPDKVLLAGAFGSYLDKANAIAIGMLPGVPEERVFVVGNSAGDGARIALLNTDKRREAAEVAGRVIRYELPTDPAFQDRFIRALAFPAQDNQPRRQA
jgi:uncharacterized 2Fe-2S/4Fe-4S cluster protein (DUF4445 family)